MSEHENGERQGEAQPSDQGGQVSQLQVTSTSQPEAPRVGAKNHKAGCPCKFCARIRENVQKAADKEARGEKVKRQLKPRQKRWVQEFADPTGPGYKNATKSAELAGYSPDAATATGIKLLRDEQVQRAIISALERRGITDDYLAVKMREGLNAEVVELAKHEGKITDERSFPDFHARHKYLETAHRLRGDFPNEPAAVQAALIVHVGDPTSQEAWEKAAEKAAEKASQTQAERLPEVKGGSD